MPKEPTLSAMDLDATSKNLPLV